MRFLMSIMLCLCSVSMTCLADVVAEAIALRDPVTDGAADLCVVYNHVEKMWFMFYFTTQVASVIPMPTMMPTITSPMSIDAHRYRWPSWRLPPVACSRLKTATPVYTSGSPTT